MYLARACEGDERTLGEGVVKCRKLAPGCLGCCNNLEGKMWLRRMPPTVEKTFPRQVNFVSALRQ